MLMITENETDQQIVVVAGATPVDSLRVVLQNGTTVPVKAPTSGGPLTATVKGRPLQVILLDSAGKVVWTFDTGTTEARADAAELTSGGVSH